ncbi:MAG: hypothetical protein WBK77_09200, partial [Alphaproteobacteria bacterium]
MADTTKLFEHCFLASNISEGDVFNIGGGGIKLKADFGNLQNLNNKINTHFSSINMEPFKHGAKEDGIKISPEYFANLFLLSQIFRKELWDKTYGDEILRKMFFMNAHNSEDEILLSDVIAANQVACSELSLLASKIMQDRGMSVKMIQGVFVRNDVSVEGKVC